MKIEEYVSGGPVEGHKGRRGYKIIAENIEDAHILGRLRRDLFNSRTLEYDECGTGKTEGLEGGLATEVKLIIK